METISLKLIDEDLHECLLPCLEGTVFHLTTQDAYKQILDDGKIINNKDNKFPLNTSSEHSHGRNLGYVCLFNLKDKSKKIIDDTLSSYYFLHPTWFRKKYDKERTESKLVYLILDSKYHHLIIDSETAKRSLDQRVPKTECWIDDHIPLDYIEKALIVNIVASAPKNLIILEHTMLSLKRQERNNR